MRYDSEDQPREVSPATHALCLLAVDEARLWGAPKATSFHMFCALQRLPVSQTLQGFEDEKILPLMVRTTTLLDMWGKVYPLLPRLLNSEGGILPEKVRTESVVLGARLDTFRVGMAHMSALADGHRSSAIALEEEIRGLEVEVDPLKEQLRMVNLFLPQERARSGGRAQGEEQ